MQQYIADIGGENLCYLASKLCMFDFYFLNCRLNFINKYSKFADSMIGISDFIIGFADSPKFKNMNVLIYRTSKRN